MAIVTVTYDTASKSLAVSIDGQSIPNVSCVHVEQSYREEEQYCFCLTIREEDKASKLTTYKQVMAANTTEAERAQAEHGVLPAYVDGAGRTHSSLLVAPAQGGVSGDVSKFFSALRERR